MNTIRRYITFYGWVQGVGFRYVCTVNPFFAYNHTVQMIICLAMTAPNPYACLVL